MTSTSKQTCKYCQKCGIQLGPLESQKWAITGYYECFCSDHAYIARYDKKALYCRMCSSMMLFSTSQLVSAMECYCDHCRIEKSFLMEIWLSSDNHAKEEARNKLFKYDYITGKEVEL